MSLFSVSVSLGFRNFRLSSDALIAVVLCGAAHFAVGQTAHFTRAQVTIGAGSFSGPVDLAFDASGDLIVADYDARAITEIVAVNGTIPASATVRRLVSGSPLLPFAVALYGKGNIFFSDIFA